MQTTGSSAVSFDPAEPGFFQDPYAQFDRLRADNPVSRSEFGVVVVSTYDEVSRMLNAPQLCTDDRGVASHRRTMLDEHSGGVVVPPENTMARLDGDDHRRLRGLVQKAFGPRAIARLQGYIDLTLGELLDRCADLGRFDVITDLAYPLTFQTICQLMGIPVSGRQELRVQVDTACRVMDLFIRPEDVRAAAGAVTEIRAYLEDIVGQRRKDPAEDLLSALITVEEQGDRLTGEELVYMAMLLFEAGQETTTNLIGNGVLALLRHPDQAALLRGGEVDRTSATEELLRYDSPVQLHARVARDTYEVGSQTLRSGDVLVGLVGSANRDEQRWGPTAATLDLTRHDAARHVSFGKGPHHCLGAALARMETADVFVSLLQRFPCLEIAQEPHFGSALYFRGLHELVVDAGRGAS
jgi:cytochrome P450